MKYRIGQKVVYIGPDVSMSPTVLMWGLKVPIPKGIYTIRGGKMLACAGEPVAAYVLEELNNRAYPCACKRDGSCCELHIEESKLRPLTDISQFHEIRKAVERNVFLTFKDSVDA